MSYLCRSVAMAAVARSAASRSKSSFTKTFSLPSRSGASPLLRRSSTPSFLAAVDSLMPLHSAIASARLKSFIAVDSSCWSWLSQGRALPL